MSRQKKVTKKMITDLENKGYRVDTAYGAIYELNGNAYHYYGPLDYNFVCELLGIE